MYNCMEMEEAKRLVSSNSNCEVEMFCLSAFTAFTVNDVYSDCDVLFSL